MKNKMKLDEQDEYYAYLDGKMSRDMDDALNSLQFHYVMRCMSVKNYHFFQLQYSYNHDEKLLKIAEEAYLKSSKSYKRKW
jgi:hypothetical protein